jgi:hypothetical protein
MHVSFLYSFWFFYSNAKCFHLYLSVQMRFSSWGLFHVTKIETEFWQIVNTWGGKHFRVPSKYWKATYEDSFGSSLKVRFLPDKILCDFVGYKMLNVTGQKVIKRKYSLNVFTCQQFRSWGSFFMYALSIVELIIPGFSMPFYVAFFKVALCSLLQGSCKLTDTICRWRISFLAYIDRSVLSF